MGCKPQTLYGGSRGLSVLGLMVISFLTGYQLRSLQEFHAAATTVVVDGLPSFPCRRNDQTPPRTTITTDVLPVTTDSRSTKRSMSSDSKTKKKRKSIVTHIPYNGTLQRVFSKYPQDELPCFKGKSFGDYRFGVDAKDGRDRKGMFYTKLSKCSSSTLAGIAVQIARNTAVRQHQKQQQKQQQQQNATTTTEAVTGTDKVVPLECLVKADHGMYRHVMARDRHHSILWTFIREPAAREVSDFFHFHVSRRGVNPTNSSALQLEALRALSISDYMTGNVFRTGKKQSATTEQKVDFIMNAYDFIGLVERYHESLILLKMIYHLELRDILYTKAKQSGGYDDGEYRDKCTYIYPSSISPTMKQWFQTSTEWQTYAQDDILLYRVVEKSLDLTIDAFGRQEVERQVILLEQALQLADEVCGPTAIYPCSSDGIKRPPEQTTCVAHDWACAHKCIETLDISQFE